MTPALVLPASAGPAGTTAVTTAAAFSPDVLAKLQELAKRSAQHEKDLLPRNTTEGYAADWKQWTEFCALLELPVAAITPGRRPRRGAAGDRRPRCSPSTCAPPC